MAELKYTTAMKKFSELKSLIEIPRFQRGLVWNSNKQREFIKTLKAGLPIGVLLLSERGDHYLVIDGLQRFTTMKKYASNYFEFIDKEEITEGDIMAVIVSSQTAKQIYDAFDRNNKQRIQEAVRDCIVKSISKGQGQNLLTISKNAANEICSTLAEFHSQEDRILDPIFAIIDAFSKNANIDDVEVPLIIFRGDDNDLATIFQKLNQEGVKLSKYDVFAASWINHTVTVKNDTAFLDLITKKYEAAEKESDLDIADYDPDVLRQTGELTVFEYAFGIGKALMNACPKLFPNNKNDSKIDSIGFLILAELMGLSYQKMGDLANTLENYKHMDYKALKDAIVDCTKTVESALGNYICAPTPKKTSLACHSELQLISYIVVIFKLKYDITMANGLIQKQGKHKELKEVKTYLHKHYLYDILRGFWSGSGDSKLEEIIAAPEICRYVKDVDRGSFEQIALEWIASSNAKKSQVNVSTEIKLFLNYLLRGRIADVDKREYDIEHCVPKKVLQDYYVKKGIDVPISPVCNLVYIPIKENRGKGEQTYYQKQAKDSDTYTLSADALDRLVYPRKSEIRFVESVDGLTEKNYVDFLAAREKVVLRAFIDGLYE